jgi:hypothetical protein
MDLNARGDKRPLFRFTGSQQRIYSSLLQKSQGLADLYEAALRVYSEERYPARLILAAHSVRELANGLPKAFDLPILVDPALITDQVNSLESVWNNALQSACHQNGEWTGPIDTPLRRLMQKLHAFFEWLKTNRPKRSEVVIQMFRSTDPSGIPLPETLEQQRAKAWQELRRYFSNTAHGESVTEEDFAAKIEALERILLDCICRTPSEDLSAIDRILEEGAGDA